MTDDYAGYNAVAAQQGIERLAARAQCSQPLLDLLKNWLFSDTPQGRYRQSADLQPNRNRQGQWAGALRLATSYAGVPANRQRCRRLRSTAAVTVLRQEHPDRKTSSTEDGVYGALTINISPRPQRSSFRTKPSSSPCRLNSQCAQAHYRRAQTSGLLAQPYHTKLARALAQGLLTLATCS